MPLLPGRIAVAHTRVYAPLRTAVVEPGQIIEAGEDIAAADLDEAHDKLLIGGYEAANLPDGVTDPFE